MTVVDTWYWEKIIYNQRCSPNLIENYNFLQIFARFIRKLWDVYLLKEGQILLTNRATLLSGEWLRFIGRIFQLLPTTLPFKTTSTRGSPRAIEFIFGVGKLEWLRYNLVTVAWCLPQSSGHNTSTWQPRCHCIGLCGNWWTESIQFSVNCDFSTSSWTAHFNRHVHSSSTFQRILLTLPYARKCIPNCLEEALGLYSL